MSCSASLTPYSSLYAVHCIHYCEMWHLATLWICVCILLYLVRMVENLKLLKLFCQLIEDSFMSVSHHNLNIWLHRGCVTFSIKLKKGSPVKEINSLKRNLFLELLLLLWATTITKHNTVWAVLRTHDWVTEPIFLLQCLIPPPIEPAPPANEIPVEHEAVIVQLKAS